MSTSMILGKVSVTTDGAWDNTKEYATLSLVTYDGGSYLSKKAVPIGTAITDTNYWFHMASKGDQYILTEADKQEIANIASTKVSKTSIGLGNVDNTSDADKPISTATQTALDDKVDKVTGKGLSSEDYTNAEKTKLAGIEEGANKFVLSKASTTELGGIIVGDNVTIDTDGKLSATLEWGNIDGTLSNQTDLQTALDSKQKKLYLQVDTPASPSEKDIWIETEYGYKHNGTVVDNFRCYIKNSSEVSITEAGVDCAILGISSTWDALTNADVTELLNAHYINSCDFTVMDFAGYSSEDYDYKTKFTRYFKGKSIQVYDGTAWLKVSDSEFVAGDNITITNKTISSNQIDDTLSTSTGKTWSINKIKENTSKVSVSETGTSTDNVKYITIDGVEKKMGIDIDDTLSTTSTNAVQNKVIATELNKKVDTSVTEDNATVSVVENEKGKHGVTVKSTVGDTVASFSTTDLNGESGIVAQVVAKSSSTNEGAMLNVKKTGLFYNKGTSATTEASQEIATLGDIEGVIGKTFQFKGYVENGEPTGAKKGELWYQSTTMPTIFPVQVKTYDGTAWSSTTTDYTPKNMELWANKNDEHGYYWFGNAWNKIDFSVNVDNTTIDYNGYNQLEVKDKGITLAKLEDHTSDVGKGYVIDTDGTTKLKNIKQYKRVSTFIGEGGNDYTLYYLDTSFDIYQVGAYIWDSTNGFTIIGANTASPILVGTVTSTGTLPTTRPDGTALILGDYVKPDSSETFPFTIGTITFTTARDTAVFMGSGNWLLNVSVYQKTNETPVNSKSTESIKGALSTAVYQADINAENATEINAVVKSGTFEKTTDGKVHLNLKNRLNTDVVESNIENVVFTEDTQTLKNKTIDADNNTVSNIAGGNLKAQTASEAKKTWVVQSDGTWALGKAGNEVDDTTIEINTDEKLQIKDKAITSGKINDDTLVTSAEVATVTFDDTQLVTAKGIETLLANKVTHYSTMPTPASALENQIVQYIGSTTTEFTNGYFYKCVSDGATTPTYSWKQIAVQSGETFEITATPTTETTGTFNKTDAEIREAISAGKLIYVALTISTDETQYFEVANIADDGSTLKMLLFVNLFLNNDPYLQVMEWNNSFATYNLTSKLSATKFQYSTMPTPNATLLNVIYQFTGTTTTDYTQGAFYICVEDTTTAGTYVWQKLGADITVIDNLTSTSSTDALSAKQGKVLQDSKEKKVIIQSSEPTDGEDTDLWLKTEAVLTHNGSAVTVSYQYYKGVDSTVVNASGITVSGVLQPWSNVTNSYVTGYLLARGLAEVVDTFEEMEFCNYNSTDYDYKSTFTLGSVAKEFYIHNDGTWNKLPTTWGSITGTLSSQSDLNTALSNKLSLSGGTMTGTITTSSAMAINASSTAGVVGISGGTGADNGAMLALFGGDYADEDEKGTFQFCATSGSDTTLLTLKPNGDFVYENGNKILDSSYIVDNLTTDDATKILSAKQGKNLQDNKSKVTVSSTGTSTTELPAYMTIDGTEYKLPEGTTGSYLPLTGGTLTGNLTVANPTQNDQLTISGNNNVAIKTNAGSSGVWRLRLYSGTSYNDGAYLQLNNNYAGDGAGHFCLSGFSEEVSGTISGELRGPIGDEGNLQWQGADGTYQNVLTAGNIANNLTTSTAGSVLDATQGKLLQDTKQKSIYLQTTSPTDSENKDIWVKPNQTYTHDGTSVTISVFYKGVTGSGYTIGVGGITTDTAYLYRWEDITDTLITGWVSSSKIAVSTSDDWVFAKYGTNAYDYTTTFDPDSAWIDLYVYNGTDYITLKNGTTWGSITGTLSSQSDLNTALSAKANASEMTTALSAKVNTSDIINNLSSTSSSKPLSANMGNTLNNSKLAVSGGTLSGQTTITPSIPFKRADSTGYTALIGGTSTADSASLLLNGKDVTDSEGTFELKATDGTNSATLIGEPDGTLTWDGVDLSKSLTHVTVDSATDINDIFTKAGLTDSGWVNVTLSNTTASVLPDGYTKGSAILTAENANNRSIIFWGGAYSRMYRRVKFNSNWGDWCSFIRSTGGTLEKDAFIEKDTSNGGGTACDAIKGTTDNSYLRFCGGSAYNKGANLLLNGNTYTANPGGFNLQAWVNGSGTALIGTQAGSLTWGGNEVLTKAIFDDDVTVTWNTATQTNYVKTVDYAYKLTFGSISIYFVKISILCSGATLPSGTETRIAESFEIDGKGRACNWVTNCQSNANWIMSTYSTYGSNRLYSATTIAIPDGTPFQIQATFTSID